MLMGRPIYKSQHAPAFSTQGDLSLVSLSWYRTITKANAGVREPSPPERTSERAVREIRSPTHAHASLSAEDDIAVKARGLSGPMAQQSARNQTVTFPNAPSPPTDADRV
jgi:hypothetical protein